MILTAMIVDKHVLGRIQPRWDKDMFRSRWSNIVAQWCVKYYEKYGKAPGKAIVHLFEHWSEGNDDKEAISLIDRYLSSLSEDWVSLRKESNPDYVLDLSEKYFNEIRIIRLREALEGDLDSSDLDNALKRIDSFGRVRIDGSSGVDVFHQEEVMVKAFEMKKDPLVVYKGALGNFFGTSLERDAFVACMAPEKGGKTFWLMDIAIRAMLQGRKVAFFEVGDLSQSQVLRRFACRTAKRPMEPGTIKYPTYIMREAESNFATVDFEEREFKTGLSLQEAIQANKKLVAKKKMKESLFKLSTHPNDSINIKEIGAILDNWERDGWIADVIVIDYADILAPVYGVKESRDQINATWKGMRALSQSRHCLVVTATQADANSYDVETLSRSNFSEDKRKYAHVTGMFGINRTSDEKEQGITRLNWIQLRESNFSEEKCVHVAGCLDLCNPAILSTF